MNRFLSVKELAEVLGVPVSWIYDRTRQGGPEQLPHYKVGKYVRFSEAEIEEYLKAKSQQAESI
ncbi:MAG: helix-turn-helix domain-containing protein [Candidatus Zixiibacteriota bacterium]